MLHLELPPLLGAMVLFEAFGAGIPTIHGTHFCMKQGIMIKPLAETIGDNNDNNEIHQSDSSCPSRGCPHVRVSVLFY